jgi:cytochrome c551/c552
MSRHALSLALTTSLLLVAACAKGKSPDDQPAGSGQAASAGGGGGGQTAVSPEAQKEAETIFSQRCTPCHGPQGAGDGPASAGLTPKPRNFKDAEWQKSVTDDHIIKIIQYGGAAVGKSAAMPPNPDLAEKQPVVAALKNHVRSLGGK